MGVEVGGVVFEDELDVGAGLGEFDGFQEDVGVATGGFVPVDGVSGPAVVGGERGWDLAFEQVQLLAQVVGTEAQADVRTHEIAVEEVCLAELLGDAERSGGNHLRKAGSVRGRDGVGLVIALLADESEEEIRGEAVVLGLLVREVGVGGRIGEREERRRGIGELGSETSGGAGRNGSPTLGMGDAQEIVEAPGVGLFGVEQRLELNIGLIDQTGAQKLDRPVGRSSTGRGPAMH